MLKFVFTDVNHNEHIFPCALSAVIHIEEGIPADDLYAVFPYRSVDELSAVAVYDDDAPVFIGIVDEQEHIVSSDGAYLRISARSLAAHLLDNEAAPQSYDHPSASLIYERYVAPFGITLSEDEDATYFGELTVTKGMSLWGVLKNFCNACFSSVPRVSSNGVLYMKDITGTKSVKFSDTADGIRYTSVSESRKRCEEISRVNVKTTNADGYTYPIDNADAVERGIVRERYLNAVLTQTPIKCADTMIENGRAASYSLSLNCPSRQLSIYGCGASVHNPILGDIDGLYVSGIRYRLTSKGESTDIILKRRYA